MGNDGGVIAVKRKFMRHANVKARGEKMNQEMLQLEKTRTCALSSQPLREPVVVCRLGNLFNKEIILEHLLAKTMPERFQYIRSLKDVVTCRATYGKGENACWCCPITMIEFTGKQPFVVLFKCGCVLSERALKAVHSLECLVCGKPFEEQDVVTLVLDEEQYEKQKRRLEQTEEKRYHKKKKTMTIKESQEVDDAKHEHMKQQKKKRSVEQLRESGDTKLVKIARDASESISKAKQKSEVFASLFSKDKKEKTSANDLLMTIGGMRYTLS